MSKLISFRVQFGLPDDEDSNRIVSILRKMIKDKLSEFAEEYKKKEEERFSPVIYWFDTKGVRHNLQEVSDYYLDNIYKYLREHRYPESARVVLTELKRRMSNDKKYDSWAIGQIENYYQNPTNRMLQIVSV